MSPIATRIHHVSIQVDDLKAAEDFYVGVLGFEVLDRPDLGIAGRWLAVGEQQVHLIEGEVPAARGQHFALGVDDLDAVVSQLEARGCKTTAISDLGVARQTFTSDPCGNLIEFNQPFSAS